MYYIIDYEIAAVFLVAIMIVSKIKLYKSEDRTIRVFMKLLLVALVCGCFDIFAALCQGSVIHVNDTHMLLIETIYLILVMYTNYYLLRLMCLRTQFESEFLHILNFALISVFTFFLLANLGKEFIFHYENLKFKGSPWFYFVYLLNMLIYLEVAMVLAIKGRKLRRKVLVLCSSSFLIPILCIVMQSFNDRILISELGVVVAMFLFGFTIGEEDYENLEIKLKELEESRDEEAHILEEAQKAKQVKEIFMDRISKKIDQPLYGVLRAGEEMREFEVSKEISEYITQINLASNQLKSFTDEFKKATDAIEE